MTMENPVPIPKQTCKDGDGKQVEDSSSFICEICINSVSSNKRFKNNNSCAHVFYCFDCIESYIHEKLRGFSLAEIKCPGSGCTQILDPLVCRSFLSKKLFERWCRVLCESTSTQYQRAYCPYQNCSSLILNECEKNPTKSTCPLCKRRLCFQCQCPWHAGYSCSEARGMTDRNDILFGKAMEINKWQRCPTCKHCVERKSGCKRIYCSDFLLHSIYHGDDEVRNLLIHYGGFFKTPRRRLTLSKKDFTGKKEVWMMNVDGDKLNMLDMQSDLKDLLLDVNMEEVKLAYIVGGKVVHVVIDADLLEMWRQLVSNLDGYCDVYVENKVYDMTEAIPEVEVEDPTIEALNAKGKEVVQEEVEKGGRKVKGKGVIVDEDDLFWSNVGNFNVNTYNVLSEDELDDDEGIEVLVVRKVATKPLPPNVEELEHEEEYHNAHSSKDELEYMIPNFAEYYNYEGETVDVYRTEANDVRPHIVEDEWERGMEWPNIKILRQEIKDYCIKNRFVGRMVVNESYRILAICEASGCPRRAYRRKKKSDGFTMRSSTF
ncbi:hypothetical protein IFM89_026120 [Coptis chinensis]|uniref:RBR-type E3 ubiquitin transferase n=1 Tax=Coptis chinensis TaxID=261450 RepID=A0A835ICY3_9MAGN|nr:hypothetical protein IFM89_026120 [Coptis chinensis]